MLPAFTPQKQQAVETALADVTAATKSYIAAQKAQKSKGDVVASHKHVLAKANALSTAIKSPLESALEAMLAFTPVFPLQCLCDMGAYAAIPTGGKSITASELASKLGADRELIVRLIRSETAAGRLVEVATEEYTHNDKSEIWLNVNVQHLLRHLTGNFIPLYKDLSRVLAADGWKEPKTQEGSPFAKIHGSVPWKFYSEHPEEREALDRGMTVHSELAAPVTESYPFQAELEKHISRSDTVVVVDVGGGIGHAIRDIRKVWPDVKGRFVLEDVQIVLDKSLPLEGTDKVAIDFFKENPVKGALAYHIRHCLHDWSDEDSVKILKNIAGAMEPGRSRLLINEFIVPATGASQEAAAFDLTMMLISGKERTVTAYSKLLDAAGLRFVKLWQEPGATHGVVEGVLK